MMNKENWLVIAVGVLTCLGGTVQAQGVPGGGQAGKVVETMDAGGYTYVAVDTGDEVVWAASSKFKVAVGDSVSIPPGAMPMKDFSSPSLGRTFESILFVGSIQVGGEAKAAAPHAMSMPGQGAQGSAELPAGHPDVEQAHSGRPISAMAEEVGVVEVAPGGMRIADVYAKAKELEGREVIVRGRVVKQNLNVMNRNWLHVQDGSGSAGDGSHDLTVTTEGSARVGDLVTVTGAVALRRDFGFGYKYPVLVERATLAVE